MKICVKCNIPYDDSQFYMRDKAMGILHKQCKLCYKNQRTITYRKHYEKYKISYLNRANERRQRLRQEFRSNMITLLDSQSCIDCGERDRRVLEFDHIDPSTKTFSISQAVKLGYSWDAVLLELEKCAVRCANCHKKRTSVQYGWYKQ